MSFTIPAINRRVNLPRKLPQTSKENSKYLDNLTKATNDQNNQIAVNMTNMLGAGLAADMPVTPQNGWMYYTTDTMHLFVGYQSAWIQVV